MKRGGKVVGVEMNWQLLIKIVSSSLLHPRSRGCSLSPGDRRRRLFRLTNLTKLREGVGVSSRDAVSILFVHANYSSWVTLLEIEGNHALPSSFFRARRKGEAGRSLPPLALGIS